MSQVFQMIKKFRNFSLHVEILNVKTSIRNAKGHGLSITRYTDTSPTWQAILKSFSSVIERSSIKRFSDFVTIIKFDITHVFMKPDKVSNYFYEFGGVILNK